MNRVRIGAAITIIVGVIYTAAGLFDSLTQIGVGLIVASAGVIVYGWADYTDRYRDDRLRRSRDEVWARRDRESRWAPGLYVIDRDDEIA